MLADSTLGKPDEKTAQSLLEPIAPGYPASWVTLAQLLYDFPELGDVDQMMKYLDNGRAADQPRAELLLGKLYYEGKMVPADAKVAEEHFQKAVGREVAADYYLGQIYRRGYLGKVYPQKALDHLLTAARNGQNSADFAIAQLFSQGKGTKPDPLNAYVFSQLAKAQNTPQATELAQTLEAQLPPDAAGRSPTPVETRTGRSRRPEPEHAATARPARRRRRGIPMKLNPFVKAGIGLTFALIWSCPTLAAMTEETKNFGLDVKITGQSEDDRDLGTAERRRRQRRRPRPASVGLRRKRRVERLRHGSGGDVHRHHRDRHPATIRRRREHRQR